MDSTKQPQQAQQYIARSWSSIGAMVTLSVMLAGCSVIGQRTSPLPQDGPSMVEIYRQHMQHEANDSSKVVRERLPLRETVDREPGTYKRTAMGMIENRFPRLHNPDLVMYVMPHLASGKYPVPGYETVFPMYETVEYAMPGEQIEKKATTPTHKSVEAPASADTQKVIAVTSVTK